MSYNDIAALAEDVDLRKRLTACAATEGRKSPSWWVESRIWRLVSQPGWSGAYAYAKAANNTRPGYDEAVITDSQILSGVQAVFGVTGE